MQIESIDMDESNLQHATRHGVSAAEISDVFDNATEVRRNRSGRSADYFVIGHSDGGRVIRVNFLYDAARCTARPISAWEVRPCRKSGKT